MGAVAVTSWRVAVSSACAKEALPANWIDNKFRRAITQKY